MSVPEAQVPLWRSEPYRVFLPLGLMLSWAGVTHWVLHASGWLEDYRLIFHAMTQIQGFMQAFALGFMFTMLPRRTQSAPPAAWQIIAGVVCTVGTTITGWFQRWSSTQMFWLVLAFILVGFVATRLFGAKAGRRAPNAFIWIPLALIIGIVGSVLASLGGVLGQQYWWMHTIGRGLLLQGMFIGFVLGVGGLVLPLMMRGEAPPDGMTTARDWKVCAAHLGAALLLSASFWIELSVSLRLAMIIRAGVILAVLLLTPARIQRPPNKPGRTRRVLWIASWMIPAGYVVAAILHEHHKAGLHVTFIGGFALLALAVGTQVALGHGGFEDLKLGRPRSVAVFTTLLLLAIVPRALMELDPDRFFVWLGIAASLFLAGTVVWAAFILPRLFPARSVSWPVQSPP